MITLNTKIVDQPATATGPIVDGTYAVKVTKVDPWKEHIKDVLINVRDERGRIVKDTAGAIVKQMSKDHKFHTADVVLEITDGPFAGRNLYTSLTTHPNASFITENFVRATGQTNVLIGDLVKTSIGKTLHVEVVNETFEKRSVDKDTGADVVELKTKAKVKTFLQ